MCLRWFSGERETWGTQVNERKPRLDGSAIALLLLCCAIWGTSQVATKVALGEVPPLLQAGLRSLGAFILVAWWSRARGVSLDWRDGTAPAGVLTGLLFAAEFACVFIGLQFTSASRIVVFIYLAPFVVALGMPWVAGSERLRPVQMVGLLAAFSGVAWAFSEGFEGPEAGRWQWLGDALGVVGALLWGATTLVIRGSQLASAAPEKTLLYQLAASALLLPLASLAAGEVWPHRVSAGILGLLLFQIVVVCSFSYLAWFWLVRHYPATQLSAFTMITPLLGLLAGVLLLGEPLTLRLVLAGIAVAAGMVLVNRRAH